MSAGEGWQSLMAVRTRLVRSSPPKIFAFSIQFAFPCRCREGPRCTVWAVGAFSLACIRIEIPENLLEMSIYIIKKQRAISSAMSRNSLHQHHNIARALEQSHSLVYIYADQATTSPGVRCLCSEGWSSSDTGFRQGASKCAEERRLRCEAISVDA